MKTEEDCAGRGPMLTEALQSHARTVAHLAVYF